jgi:hybrid cluster-associated redox disulfide protein
MTKKQSKEKIEKHVGKVTKDMLISEIMEKFPELAEFLVFEYGLHCVGCVVASFETLEQGALAHDIKGNDLDDMIDQLNKIITGEMKYPEDFSDEGDESGEK